MTSLQNHHGSQEHPETQLRSVATHGSLPSAELERVVVDGRHLTAGGRAFRVRGVTYGSFVPRWDGELFPEPHLVERDFAAMGGLGLNVARTYAPPPPDVLELAERHGVRLLVGLHYPDWRMERHPGRAGHRRVEAAGLRAAEETMSRCASSRAVIAICVGNELPGDLVRVHGISGVERVLSRLADEIHACDPNMLVTYANYPTTEYLEVDGLDLIAFNVFLERPDQFRPYVRHLQTVAGDRPLIVSEMGLASLVHGLDAQAAGLDWQLRIVDESGCAGATVFSWTDEWGVNGEAVEGWGFGITTDERMPKPAIEAVRQWTGRSLCDLRDKWPSVSVVVCAYNEARSIERCLTSLAACTYPNLEVIVCDDGSTDETAAIAHRFPFRTLEVSHGGLSRARNAGIDAASGEIVAFLDADAECHPEWPFHLVLSMDDDAVVATGGPNLPFDGAPFIERAVARSPGAPVEVLVADDRAEHVPGCNMAFRKEALVAVGGFDPIYTSAGDDVDVCWKLLDTGRQIAFSSAAQVRHHRRATVKGYLRQQRGYGRAEKLLWRSHRHRFNRLGQARWSGFIYGRGHLLPWLLRPVVYHGWQGQAPFQAVTARPAEIAVGWAGALLPLTVVAAMAAVVAGVVVAPSWFAAATAMPAIVFMYGAAVAVSVRVPPGESSPVCLRATIGLFHTLQPFVRTWGRLRGGQRSSDRTSSPAPWWGDRTSWLRELDRHLRAEGVGVRSGGPRDRWDMQASGIGVRVRVTTAVAWRWQPHWRQRLRPRAQGLVALLAIAGLAVTGPAGQILAGVAALVLIADTVHLVRAVSRARLASTRGAR